MRMPAIGACNPIARRRFETSCICANRGYIAIHRGFGRPL
ncbi:hypothetical protein C7S13_2846 [Burkholderia cepacia]|nr:hypothetical protein [Burkholderia cepacia]